MKGTGRHRRETAETRRSAIRGSAKTEKGEALPFLATETPRERDKFPPRGGYLARHWMRDVPAGWDRAHCRSFDSRAVPVSVVSLTLARARAAGVRRFDPTSIFGRPGRPLMVMLNIDYQLAA